MKVLTEGHLYQLGNFENPNKGQILQFIQMVSKSRESADLVTVIDGTTNEEVLAALINRIEYLQSKFPCKENKSALLSLESALIALNLRTENRKARNVEGKNLV